MEEKKYLNIFNKIGYGSRHSRNTDYDCIFRTDIFDYKEWFRARAAGNFPLFFSTDANLFVLNMTLAAVESFGGGAAGWRGVAILYAVIGLAVNTFSVFSLKELPEEESV